MSVAITAQGFGRFGGRVSDVEAPLAVAAAAALVLIPVFHTLAALAFLGFGMLLVIARPTPMLAVLWRYRLIFVLPVFCTLSTLWSEAPGASLRAGVQLTATCVIAVVLAARLPQQAFLIAVFAALMMTVALSLALGSYRADTGALVGFYGSKNAMAWAAALSTLLAVGLAAARGVPGVVRLGAAVSAPIALAAMVLAQSVSALGYLPIGLTAFAAILLMRPFRASVRIVTALFLTLGLTYLLLLATIHAEALSAAFFDATGKDVTLTGRTDLWQIALAYISERPALGVGYQAFWIHGNPTAEAIWRAFGIASRSGFNFHNTYLSNAVEIGMTGVAMQVVLMAAAFLVTARRALATGDPVDALMFAAVAMLMSITPVEVPVFTQFNLQSVLVIVAIVYATKPRAQ